METMTYVDKSNYAESINYLTNTQLAEIIHPALDNKSNFSENSLLQEPLYPYFERYPGFVEERFQELMYDSRIKAQNITSPRLDETKQLAEIDALREDLYHALPNARPRSGEMEDRAYDIVKDVWNFRKLQNEIALLSDSEKKSALQIYEKYIELQMRTFLEEICNVYGHKTIYKFRNGVMYMDALSKKQSFEEIIAFGVAVEEHEGSVESKRVEDELRGCIQMSEFGRFSNIGGRYMLISPRGIHPNTKYKRNYIDIGEKKIDPKTGEIYLEVTRFKSPHSYEEYEQIIPNSSILINNKKYFNNVDRANLDGHYLSHLLLPHQSTTAVTVEDLYESLFKKHPDAITEEDFMSKVYVNCFPEVKAYVYLVCNNASWEALAEAYTAIINKCASLLIDVRNGEYKSVKSYDRIINFDNDDWQHSIAMASAEGLQVWGRQAMITLDADCGSVKAYLSVVDSVTTTAILESLTLANQLENSVAQTGVRGLELEDGKGPLEFLCEPPKGCGRMIKRPWGKLLSNCYLCGADLHCGTGSSNTVSTELSQAAKEDGVVVYDALKSNPDREHVRIELPNKGIVTKKNVNNTDSFKLTDKSSKQLKKESEEVLVETT